MSAICSTHGRVCMARECATCGRAAERLLGVFLERLYPNQTACTGCGRRQVHCTCERTGVRA